MSDAPRSGGLFTVFFEMDPLLSDPKFPLDSSCPLSQNAKCERDRRRKGTEVYYRLKTPCILKFFACVEETIQGQVAEHRRLARKIR